MCSCVVLLANRGQPRQTVASYGGVGRGREPMHHGHGGKEAEVDNDAERFFRAVDRAMLEHHSKPSGLPLILAALPEHHHMFREVSRNPFLLPESLDVHPDSLPSIEELRRLAWQLLEPTYIARTEALVDEFGKAHATGTGDSDLAQVAAAVVAGRVATLLIEARREVPGRVDDATGAIQADDLEHPKVDDVLDDLAALVLKHGGKVVVVPSARMPSDTGVAAIYRY